MTESKPVLEVDAAGTKRWKLDGALHRDDGPAIEFTDGSTAWYLNGHCHRDDGPAIEYADGEKRWYRHGELHREDGPALEWRDSTKWWFLHSEQHSKPEWLREVLKDRPLTTNQRDLLNALSENWDGTPDLLYETVTHLAK